MEHVYGRNIDLTSVVRHNPPRDVPPGHLPVCILSCHLYLRHFQLFTYYLLVNLVIMYIIIILLSASGHAAIFARGIIIPKK